VLLPFSFSISSPGRLCSRSVIAVLRVCCHQRLLVSWIHPYSIHSRLELIRKPRLSSAHWHPRHPPTPLPNSRPASLTLDLRSLIPRLRSKACCWLGTRMVGPGLTRIFLNFGLYPPSSRPRPSNEAFRLLQTPSSHSI
jgi:hypothetical protein